MTTSELMLIFAICALLMPVLLYLLSRLISNAYFAAKLDYQRKLLDDLTETRRRGENKG